MNIFFKRWACALVPFAVSLTLSCSTVGKNVFWQDSGFYLACVKDLGILYPPGFVAYLLLCKLWTLFLGLFGVDFVLAVHLFSSFCAALAAAAMGLAARDLLCARGKLFQLTAEDPGAAADWVGAIVGCLLASGYTFWFSGLYAKGYSFLYLVLALLMWRMIRADESRRPRDLTIVAALIGLAWQAHPSATLAGLALILFVLSSRSVVGWKGIAWRVGVAAATALGPLLVIPILGARDPDVAFAAGTFDDLPKYVLGSRYTTVPGVFGFTISRWVTFCRYFWEEMLGVGIVLILIGILKLVRANRRLLLGIAAWMAPYVVGAVLFKMEGQQDHWFVAGWLPLYLAMGVGLLEVGRLVAKGSKPVLCGVAVAATAWAVAVNYPLVNQRGYDLAELYGRCLLDPVDQDSILIVYGDDALAICEYMQQVRGHRRDVLVLFPGGLSTEKGDLSWYDKKIMKRDPRLRKPDYVGAARRFSYAKAQDQTVAAFVNQNAEVRPIFTMIQPWSEMIRPDFTAVPAGVLQKIARRTDTSPRQRYWDLPVTPEKVLPRFRRERGIWLQFKSDDVIFGFEPYERRLLRLLIRARANLAYEDFKLGTPDGLRRAVIRLESILQLDPQPEREPDEAYLLALAYYRQGREERAEKLLTIILPFETSPKNRAGTFIVLAEIARKRGKESEAQNLFSRARAEPGLDPESLKEIDRIANALEYNPPGPK